VSALPNFEHAVMSAGCRVAYAQKLRDIGATCGYLLDHKATRRVRGWPEKSRKPWHILYGDGTLCASFATLDQLEKNLRARAGC
jgi:hypothetical protein